MAMKVTRIGTNEDGTPHYAYIDAEGNVAQSHLLITGPGASGPVTLSDGTTYELSPAVIEIQCEGHEIPGDPTSPALGICHDDEINHQLGLKYNAEGHPLAPGFVYPHATVEEYKAAKASLNAPAPVVVTDAPATTQEG